MTFNTPFSYIYDSFLSKITDDMYLELTELDTYALMQELLVAAIPYFEFPKCNLLDYTLGESEETTYQGVETNNVEVPATVYNDGAFNLILTSEEINILATYMIVEWIGRQLASVEVTRMKYSGSDFKFTSQANHLAKLITLKQQYTQEGFHLQRLYKRRAYDKDGHARSTMDIIGIVPQEVSYQETPYAEAQRAAELKSLAQELTATS